MSLDNPLVLLVLLLLGALTAWLTKKRQRKEAENWPGEEEGLPPRPQGRSTSQPDWEEALRQLLGGEPPPQAPPPPPIPQLVRAGRASDVPSDEEHFQPEWTGRDETREFGETASPRVNPITAPPRRRPSLVQPSAFFAEANERPEVAARPFKRLGAPLRPPAAVVITGLGRRSSDGARAVALVRDARTVRQAFIASQVLSSPKALES